MWKVIHDLVLLKIVTPFVVMWLTITLVMAHRRVLAIKHERTTVCVTEADIAGCNELDVSTPVVKKIHNRVKQILNPHENRKVTLIITCTKEDPEYFALAMDRIKEQQCLSVLNIVVVFDQWDNKDASDEQCLEIAKPLADVILFTNVRCKRTNLAHALKHAKKKGILHSYLALMDSDTVCDDAWVLARLCVSFENESQVGGVTTAQRALRTDNVYERIGDWLENARLKSSMAAGSYYGQVGCLPGRLYLVRTALVENRIVNELPYEVWSGYKPTIKFPLVERWESKAKAGDDRQITNFVLAAGFQTKLVPDAGVQTLIPDSFGKLVRTWRRWATSSQHYCYRSFEVLRTHPFVLYHYFSDIVISHLSVIMVLSWLSSFWFKDERILFSLGVMIGLSMVGVLLTFAIRQWPHLKEHPHDWWYLPVFVLIVTLGQFIRVVAHYSPWRIGTWGTRRGVDDSVKKPWCKEYKGNG